MLLNANVSVPPLPPLSASQLEQLQSGIYESAANRFQPAKDSKF